MSQEQITPLAQQLAEDNGLDWRKIAGSGPGGKILEGDVLEYLAHQLAGSTLPEPSSPPPFEIDLNPQPPISQPAPSVFAAWTADPLTEDQPLVWGKRNEPPPAVEELPRPVPPPVVQVVESAPPPMAESAPVVSMMEPALSSAVVETVLPPLPEPVLTPPVTLWQPVVLWQRWIPLEAATQAAQTLGQAWGQPIGLQDLLLRAAQLAGRSLHSQSRVLRGQLDKDQLLVYALAELQPLRDWLAHPALPAVTPQPEDWVVLYLGEGPVDLASGPATHMICLGQEREGWAPLACTGPWNPQTAQDLLEAVENHLRQPVLLV